MKLKATESTAVQLFASYRRKGMAADKAMAIVGASLQIAQQDLADLLTSLELLDKALSALSVQITIHPYITVIRHHVTQVWGPAHCLERHAPPGPAIQLLILVVQCSTLAHVLKISELSVVLLASVVLTQT